MPEQAEVQFGREICGDLVAAESREWLVTNGIGGYASGTVAGSQTRRYHGVLIAALQPPVGRTQLVSTIDEIVHYAGADFSLATHRWASGAVDPQGFLLLEDFHLEGSTPVWTYALADAVLEKRVWMRQGENTTFIQYTLVRGSAALEMELKALVNYRDFHSLTHAGDWRMQIEPVEHGVKVLALDGARPFYLKSSTATCQPRHDWYLDCFLGEETARGLDDREDRLFAALFRAKLEAGSSITLVATTEAAASLDIETARAERPNYEVKLFHDWQAKNEALVEEAPTWLWQLILAADQFIVKRSLPEEPDGRSIIAGYHWFGDWGRDTMIALPGLTLATGRTAVARQILLAFSRYVDGGMLPNNFPDVGGQPEYNTVDAALWYIESVRQYFEATQDAVTLQRLFPVLAAIVEAHIAGTRYSIHADPADGLLYAGGPGVPLTWMDAKIGDWVVTPRTGKPVEINALWINALETITGLARLLAKPGDHCEKLAAKAKKSFQRFWNPARNCCWDVVDSPGIGNDASLRPNQILAVSLPVSPLTSEQQKAVVDVCARHLLTSHGLRSLAPGEAGYAGHYGGSPRDRDAAYHQGTVWGWLLGPFALAHYRIYRDREAALRFLEPLGRQIYASGLGTLSEIFDGDAPFTPRGCIAQAWTVAEVLRAWKEIMGGKKPDSVRSI
ncbi:MAG: glycogen debranching protein [Acidobacteria bacterium 13_1_20CM_58_21]|nr:MAG: glycogen debranching protein [Acidobacteria bacterium 13_1_20CM_58_21]